MRICPRLGSPCSTRVRTPSTGQKRTPSSKLRRHRGQEVMAAPHPPALLVAGPPSSPQSCSTRVCPCQSTAPNGYDDEVWTALLAVILATPASSVAPATPKAATPKAATPKEEPTLPLASEFADVELRYQRGAVSLIKITAGRF